MHAETPVEKIVIAGGGAAGWMAASILARLVGTDLCAIHVVEDKSADSGLGVPGAGEILSPAAVEATALLGYDEDLLVSATRGTVLLGTALGGWSAGAPAFLPVGDLGAPLGAVAFHQLVARRRAEGASCNLADYSLEALCAQTGRFARPQPDDQSVHATIRHGLHIDGSAFALAMKGDAFARGVTASGEKIRAVQRDGTGLIEALLTDSEARVEGDLFIDASGPERVLSGGHGFESWGAWLPCDRIATALRPDPAEPRCFAHVEAHEAGWQRFAALQGAVEESVVFSAQALRDAPAARAFRPGRASRPWSGNCIAIGGAAAVIDPISNLQFRLAQSALIRLAGLMPTDRGCRAEASEYNRQTIAELDRARDYAILFYALNRRMQDGFWDRARAAPLPDELAHRIALYQSCGRVALHDDDSVEEAGWVALFDALGLRPHRHDALADGIAAPALEAHFSRIRAAMLAAVKTMPGHGETLRGMAR